jgi:hypothetical protein
VYHLQIVQPMRILLPTAASRHVPDLVTLHNHTVTPV